MENQVPITKYRQYSRDELVRMFENCKNDPNYVIELKHRVERGGY